MYERKLFYKLWNESSFPITKYLWYELFEFVFFFEQSSCASGDWLHRMTSCWRRYHSFVDKKNINQTNASILFNNSNKSAIIVELRNLLWRSIVCIVFCCGCDLIKHLDGHGFLINDSISSMSIFAY